MQDEYSLNTRTILDATEAVWFSCGRDHKCEVVDEDLGLLLARRLLLQAARAVPQYHEITGLTQVSRDFVWAGAHAVRFSADGDARRLKMPKSPRPRMY